MQDEFCEYIDTTESSAHEVTMDAISREYEQLKKSPFSARNANPYLLDLYKIELSVSQMESQLSQLLQSSKPEDPSKNAIIAAINISKEATMEYDIKAPISEALKSSIMSDIAKLQESIQDIHQMIVKLEEASENNSFPTMLSELEKVAMILSPSFLSRMDTEYSVRLVLCCHCCSDSFSNLLNTRRSSRRDCSSIEKCMTRRPCFCRASEKWRN